jgi:3-deoxy-7-phosphoheptulonate synthase/chorismate mutase
MTSPRPVPARLRQLRERLDRVNREILRLVQQRGELMLEVAALKDELGLDSYDPRREAEMVRELTAQAGDGPFTSEELAALFRQLFATSLDLQRRMRAASVAAEQAPAHRHPHIKVSGS